MIYIEKNTTNNIILEVSNITSYLYWVFKFTPEWTSDTTPFWFTTLNIKPNSAGLRYDEFLLEESDSGSVSPANAVPIKLEAGQWKYEIFGSDSPINFSTLNIYNESVSEGRMYVE
jgi:hypothetical protein